MGVHPCLGISFLHLQKGYLREWHENTLGLMTEAKRIVFLERIYSISIGL